MMGYTSGCLVLAAVVATALGLDPLPSCPEGWEVVPKHWSCTKFFAGRKNYADAKKTCADLDATLPVARNDFEADNIIDFKIDTQHIWLGMTDEATEGTWLFNDNHKDYKCNNFKWHSIENNGGTIENCAVLMNSGVWGDVKCAGRYPFVCVARAGDATPSGPSDADPKKCKEMKAKNKLTKKYCKKEGKKLCKVSCKNAQVVDKDPKKCAKKAKEGKMKEFCKGKKGKKACKATCASLK